MEMHRIFRNVGFAVALSIAVGSAQAPSEAKFGVSTTPASVPGTQVAKTASFSPVASDSSAKARTKPAKADTDLEKAKAKGIAERKKFDKAEDAIEKSSDKLDNAYLKAAEERSKAHRKKEKARRTP